MRRVSNQIDSKRARVLLARCYWNDGSVEIDSSHPDAAIAAHKEASAIQQKLVDDYPDDVRLKVDLVNTYLGMGYNLIAHANKPADALVSFERAREIQVQVVAAEPERPEYLRVLSECNSLAGLVHLEMGRPDPALVALERAQAILRKLVESNPNVTMFQNFLAGDLGNIGIAYAKKGDRAKSLEAYTASRRILEKLVASDPSALKLQRDLAGTLNNIGDVELSLGRVSEARAAYSQAREIARAPGQSPSPSAATPAGTGVQPRRSGARQPEAGRDLGRSRRPARIKRDLGSAHTLDERVAVHPRR